MLFTAIIQGKFDIMDLGVDEDEHSIEMHLPYIAKVRAPSLLLELVLSSIFTFNYI